MARTKPIQYVPLEERPEFIAAVAALPADPAELERTAAGVRQLYHDAMLAGDLQALDDADLVYRACVVKLNGGTHFGSADIQKALEAKFAAVAGQVPGWGQAGEFLLEVEGVRLVVKMCPDSLSNHCGAELHAVDFDKPFVSRTGYRHQYMRPSQHLGRSVDQAVRAEVLELLAGEGKAATITNEYGAAKDRRVWPWLSDALAGVRPDGQLAMFGDAPKDPEAKVPLTNAQRQKALRERRKAKQLKPVMLTETERQWLDQLRELGGGEPVQGGNGDFATLEVTDARLQPVWEQLPTDFARCATALGLLRQRNNQHAELAHAVEVLQERLRAAGLSDRINDHKQQWHWNTCPFVDYRATSAPEYMERISRKLSPADDRAALARHVEHLEKEQTLLEAERNKAFAANRTLTERLRRAGLPTDYRPQPGE